MTDISVTANQVKWISGTRPMVVKGGAAITAGQAVYLNTTTLEHELADADTDATSVFAGIAITGGQDGADMLIAPPGAVIDFGATLTAGTIYVVSPTAGGIAPWADLTAGDYVVVLAIGAGTRQAEIIGKRGAAVHA
ncbi:MAG: hypothetical protein BroJett033_7990 [Chloroflexota bacterium]|nr:MAG: hypothetical protein BroJett033_7990 [Chloroflexota bacterium]